MNKPLVKPTDITCAEQVMSLLSTDMPPEWEEAEPERLPGFENMVGFHGCNGLVIVDLLTMCRFNPARATRDPNYRPGFSITLNPSYEGWDTDKWPTYARNADYDPLEVARIYADSASSTANIRRPNEAEFVSMQFILSFGATALNGSKYKIRPGTLPIEGLENIPEVVFNQSPHIDDVFSIHSVGPLSPTMLDVIASGIPGSNRKLI